MKKILVIDDEAIVRMSCERALASEGCEVKTAESGNVGINMLENEPFNLILLDMKMPGMDGLEVLKIVKKRWAETKVIIVTGYSTDQTAAETLKLGACDFIEKPFTPDTLAASVAEALKK
ncbi:MAG: response regulator [Nitrospirae bacterium]|nr:response regulator [Nitrospirota bacterium]